jgi:hypothetical protein
MRQGIWITGIVLSLAAVAWGDEKLNLRFNCPAGTYVISQKTDSLLSSVMNGQVGQSRPMKETMAKDLEVVIAAADPNGQRHMTMAFKRIRRVDTVGSTRVTEFDSDAPAAMANPMMAMMAKLYGAMLKARVEATLDAQGKLIKTAGMDKDFQELARTDPNIKVMYEQMKESGGDGNKEIVSRIASLTELLPPHPVAKGETWETTKSISIPGQEAGLKLTCTLEDIRAGKDGKTAVIGFVGTQMTGGDGQVADYGNRKMLVRKMTTNVTGTKEIDVETGLPTRSRISYDISTEMVLGPPPAKKPGPFSMSNLVQNVSGTAEVTVTKGKYVPAAGKSGDGSTVVAP